LTLKKGIYNDSHNKFSLPSHFTNRKIFMRSTIEYFFELKFDIISIPAKGAPDYVKNAG
jgi:hypothetical protein